MQQVGPAGRSPSTLVDLFEGTFTSAPADTAYVFLEDGETEAARLTRADLLTGARAVAVMLRETASIGDRALLLYPSGPDFVLAYLGCLFAGITPVPCYPPARTRTDARLAAIASSADPRLVLATDKVIAATSSRAADYRGLANARWLGTSTIDLSLASSWTRPAITGDTTALMQYTSGSTSDPRGVVVSHANLIANFRDVDTDLQHDAASVMVTWLPIFHDLGLIYGLLQGFRNGYPTVMMPPAAFLQQPSRWVRAISRYRATHSAGPNFAYDLCAARTTPDVVAELDLSTWRVAVNGAEPVRKETLARFTERFGPAGFKRRTFCPAFGLAEATLLVSMVPNGEEPSVISLDAAALTRREVLRSSAAGARTLVGHSQPVNDTELVIVDPGTLTPSAPATIGEIWVRGPVVANGYFGQPEATAATFEARLADGSGPYLRTGDLGFVEQGQLFITGRLKDVIVLRGLNYYPQDIEGTVETAHAALAAAGSAAFAIEHDGEERLAVVVEIDRMARRDVDASAVFDAILGAVQAEHGVAVEAITLLEPRTLPKTTSGKVRRRTCRDRFLAEDLPAIASWRRAAVNAPPSSSAPGATTTDLRSWLIQRFAAKLQVAPQAIDPAASLAQYGVDSVDAIALAAELEAMLGRGVAPTLVYDYPTIDALAAHLTAGDAPSGAASTRDTSASGAIAVIGLGCRFPGARNPDGFWQLLRDGVDAVSDVPASRWDAAAVQASNTSGAVSRRGGFVDDVDLFDAEFFGIAPREAERMDPQQRLMLEIGWEALEDAAIAPDSLGGSRTGVFVGATGSDYARLLMAGGGAGDIYLGTGTALSITANRLSYLLDLKGPSMAVDTACSSSLVSIALACESLRRGESTLALAGGVNLVLTPDYTVAFSNAGMMAADGRCKAFDAAADGYVRGEGAGLVVLKRLEDAERDGDRILAVVRGVATNQDGRTAGLTAPNGPSQRAVIRAALDDAGIAPARVSYIEAHGTGTSLGDPIEVHALSSVLAEGRPSTSPCLIGSVKTNIGHLESAAGIAGFIKTVLALGHREIPASLHLGDLNPRLELDGSPMQVATSHTAWPASELPRVAGVSSFGFGGTNAHVVIEEYAQPAAAAGSRPTELLTISARDDRALTDLVDRYVELLDQPDAPAFADVCRSSQDGRTAMPERLAVAAPSAADAAAALRAWSRGERDLPGVRHARAAAREGADVVFLFTGQGSQYPGMGRALFEAEPVYRAAVDECSAILEPVIGVRLTDALYGDAPAALDDMRLTQPAIFVVEYALSRLWRSWGIEPAAVIGHSLGEFAAAQVAGCLSLDDALRLVAARGRLLHGVTADGAMVSALASRETVEHAIAPWGAELAIAAVNGAASVVFSGARKAAEEAAARLAATGVKCKVLAIAQASHSPLVDEILDAFTAEASTIDARPPRIPLVSNVTGAWRSEAPDAAYWRRHLRQPVLFADGLETLGQAGHRVFLELGPHPTLAALGEQSGVGGATWIASLHRDTDAGEHLARALGALWTAGARIDWRAVHASRPRRAVALPTYPFQRRRFWVPQGRPATVSPQAGHPLLGSRLHVATAAGDRVFESRLSTARPAYLGEHRAFGAAFVPSAALIEMMLAGAGLAGGAAISDLEMLRPLRLDGDAERVVQTVFAADGDVRVFSRDAAGEEWTLHATARVAAHALSAAAGASLDAHATLESIDAQELYASLESRGITLGPAYWRLAGIRRAAGSATATVDAGAGDPLDLPLVLDAVLQTAAAAVPEAYERDHALVQARIERIAVRLPLEGALRCEARARAGAATFDIVAIDASGRTVVDVRGLTLRPIDRAAITNTEGASLYEIDWIERPVRARAAAADRGWIVLDADGTGRALAAELTSRGDRAIVVRPGERFGADADGALRIAADDAGDYGRMIAFASKAFGREPDGLVHMWSLAADTTLSAPALEDAVGLGAMSLVRTVDALVSSTASTRMWIVTRMATAAGRGPDPSGVLQSPAYGIARNIALEHPDRWGAHLDIDADASAARRLAGEIAQADVDEDAVAFRGGRRLAARVRAAGAAPAARPALSPDATYLITGGLGTLGLSTASAMVDAGARHLLLAGRTGVTPGRRAAIAALEARGAAVRVATIDISDVAAVRALVAELASSGPRLAGILHAAGAPGFSPLRDIRAAGFAAAFAAKASGALALATATAGTPLDFFACVSSMVSSWGADGQAHYVAANHFTDMLMQQLRGEGRHAISIAIGPLEGGMLPEDAAASMRRMGVAVWPMAYAADVIVRLLPASRGHVIAAGIDWQRFAPLLESRRRLALFDAVRAVEYAPDRRADTRAALAERLRAADAGERDAIALEGTLLEAAAALGMTPGEWGDLGRGFFDMGMDSLTALDLRKRLERALGRPLPATIVFDHPNVAALAAAVLALTAPAVAPAPQASAPDALSPTGVAGEADADALAATLARLERLVERT